MAYQDDRITGIPAPLPKDYDRGYSFTDFQTINPGKPASGAALDNEFANIEQALDETQARLRLIQRDDGALANSSVGLDQLKAEVGSVELGQGRVVPLDSVAALNSQWITDAIAAGEILDGQQFSVKDGDKIRLFAWNAGTESFDELPVGTDTDNVTGAGTAITRDTGTAMDQVPLNTNIVYPLPDITSLSSLNTAALVDGQQFSVTDGDKQRIFYWDDTAGEFKEAYQSRNEYDTLSDLKSETKLSIGQKVKTFGYNSVGDGGGNEYEIVAALTGTDDGGSFIDLPGSAFQAKGLFPGKYVYPEQFGAIGDEIADDTVANNAAAALGDPVLLRSKYKVTDRINYNKDQVVSGIGRTLCGFVIDTSFNMAASGVVRPGTGEPGASLCDFGFFFYQDTTETVRANIIQYPPAIDASSTPRVYIQRIRIERAYDGIDITGNSGGSFLLDLELGCINKGIETDGALDFMFFDNLEFWPYGFPGTNMATSIYSDGNTIAIDGKNIDGISFGTISPFRARVIIDGGFGGISNLMGDGSYSRLEVKGGAKLTVGSMYSTSSAADDFAIQLSGLETKCVIGALWIENALDSTGSEGLIQAIGNAASELIISTLHVNTTGASTRAIYQSGGTLTVESGFFEMPEINLVNDFIKCVGGEIHIRGVRCTDNTGVTGNVISVDNDGRHSLQNVIAPGWPVDLPPSSQLMQIDNCEFATVTAGTRELTSQRTFRLSGTLDANGQLTIAHGLSSPHTRYPEILAFRHVGGARFPIDVNFIDGTNVKVTSPNGASASGETAEISITI